MADQWDRAFFSLPIGAGRSDVVAGYTEWGEPVYESPNGRQYWFGGNPYAEPQKPPRSTRDVYRTDAEGRTYRDYEAHDNGAAQSGAGALASIPASMWSVIRAPTNGNATYGDAFSAAGMVQLGASQNALSVYNASKLYPDAGEVALASRGATLYTRPTKSEVGDVLGRTGPGGVDLEGRPLVARHVVGGTPDRALEQSLPSEAVAEIVERFTGKGIQRASRRELGGRAVGQTRFDRLTGSPLGVDVWDGLSPAQFGGVSRHEVGHLLDEISGQIDVKGLSDELKPLYHYGVEGRERPNKHTLPQHVGYSKAEEPREYMAEAIRQYMGAPDAMKAMAPKTAARIRAAINSHPEISKIVQFNTALGGLIGGGAFAQGDSQDPRAEIIEYLARNGT